MQWIFLFVFFTLLVAVLIVAPTNHVIATIPIAFSGAIIIFNQIPKGKHALPLEAFAVASHWSYPQCSVPPLEAAPWLG